jgi:hypothetical protein
MDYKYERLPNFCFGCGRIGHKLKDFEEIEDPDEDTYNGVEEKEQAFGPWIRASPLPKISYEAKKDSSSGTCSKSLFPSTSNCKNLNSEGAKEVEEEVEQQKAPSRNHEKSVEGEVNMVGDAQKDVEGEAEFFWVVSISSVSIKGIEEASSKAPDDSNFYDIFSIIYY